jgi:hypothetical protein
MSVVVASQRKPHANQPAITQFSGGLRTLVVSRLRGWKTGGRFLVVLCRSERRIIRRDYRQKNESGN